ncbi:MAG: hypothetical protein UU93_C0001G0074 [Candidatus Amesbacteria bacterium GW2011_GWA2_42_12]|uniref:Glycosyl hydrolases family 39 N-terminal catalytic domain-containing protein n=1 Tax=Candidatus Amesbacteria bacterium GW2011_GWA2_42_12 TaxID=1618356 RepID=A0A0G1B6X4_9BACT|nr:MAG: hypothetical protein UU93_C0001G0074 [Candidatus Amesbacteria bacterium GW2011_GWA2_42_12]
MALLLPVILQALNSISRLLVGAEGRLAAISVQTDRPLGIMSKPWQALAQGGEDVGTFLDNNTAQVMNLKPQQIRIDHLYDGYNVVSKNDNTLVFDWSRLDIQVDKIRATGAMPFFSLSYMPPVISKSDIVDEPKDYSEWQLVVQKTIEHYSGEKGLNNIYYEVWNEPDLFGKWKMGGKKDYRKLYTFASRGAQQARGVKPFKIGGVATTGLYDNWVNYFFPYILENRLRLDFYSWHRYDKNLDKFTQDVNQVRTLIDSQPYFANVEKIISEMGPDSEQGGDNDTRLGAAHLVAVAGELIGKIKYGFSFAVSGSWGILGKPRYEALRFLNMLGDQRLSLTGEGTWVKAIGGLKDNTYQVLLVNYDPQNAHSEVVPVSFMDLKPGTFTLKQSVMLGGVIQSEIATTEAMLQKSIPMTPNSVVLLELIPKKY